MLSVLPRGYTLCGMSDRWTMIGGFVALAGLILFQANATRADLRDIRAELRDIRVEIRDIRTELVDLNERVTRIETRLDYEIPRQSEPSPDTSQAG